ncbi:7,8-didemethyl-8-hydroxy-5-deazariboflavin synthase subunit CofG [Archaeoglobus neptunius]|uniref:7,8-didemethyl-8-hydroxy-5-deazariboflavin synthase subunit CofG n=1 Tax=Archaeoglobus neptunius TaxID=2798580 RepID=UPI0019283BE9
MEIVTYSKNVFIPLTPNCRNRCAYCGYRSDEPKLMSEGEVRSLLSKASGAKEALFTFGERPDEAYPEIRRMLKEMGYSDFVDYIAHMNKIAVRTGFLPHTNAGILSKNELARLKDLNASMGLMLEQAVELECHRDSPGKKPEVRIKMIRNAGRLEIPFTTGILVGIGERKYDRQYSLEVIADLHSNYGHVQEVIIQNFKPKKGTRMENSSPPTTEEMLETVKIAREILPEDVVVQIPPNLVDDIYPFVKAGARDVGGISNVTHDFINPESPWPEIERIQSMLRGEFALKERLSLYPKFVKLKWYSTILEPLIEKYADADGYARP